MTLRLRRILYSTAFGLFFVSTPLLTMYASGYRFDAKVLRITRVGGFFVKSYPSGALVSVDGKSLGKRTPARLLGIDPGPHELAVSRGGFQTWQKRLIVAPKETTFVEDILLFRESPKQIRLSDGGSSPVASHDKALYAHLSSPTTIVITQVDTANTATVTIPRPARALLAFAPTNDELLLNLGGTFATININTEKLTELKIPRGATHFSFDGSKSGRIWYLSNRSVQYVDGDKIALNAHTQKRFDDFKISANQATGLELAPDGVATISVFMLDDSSQLLWKKEIQAGPDISISDFREQTVLATSPEVLWLLTEAGTERIDASYYGWHGSVLLAANQFEIYTYSLESKTKKLIDRTAETLRAIGWHPSGSYILRQREKSIELLELDERDRRNIAFVVSQEQPLFIEFDTKGERLYLLTETDNTVFEIQ